MSRDANVKPLAADTVTERALMMLVVESRQSAESAERVARAVAELAVAKGVIRRNGAP